MADGSGIYEERLTACMDFPCYYVDIESGRVFHKVWKTAQKEYIYREVKGRFPHSDSRSRWLSIRDNHGMKRAVSISRLLYAARYGISVDDIPSDIFVTYTQDGFDIKSPAEASAQGWKARKDRMMLQRVKELEKVQREIELLLKAYNGDLIPLTEYVYSRKECYIRTLTKSYLQMGEQRATEAVEMTLDYLFNQVRFGGSSIFSLEAWIVKVAKSKARQIANERAKNVMFDDKIMM